ncbi:MAG: flagellar basal body rod protein FlgB [Candidatus Scalinduaceae bacterium]
MDIFDKNTELLSKILDLTSVRNKVIANNIANANTPDYKKLEVKFQKELEKAIENRNSLEKIKDIKAKIIFSKNKENDIDKELVEFFKSSDRYNMTLEIITKKYKSLISAIDGR